MYLFRTINTLKPIISEIKKKALEPKCYLIVDRFRIILFFPFLQTASQPPIKNQFVHRYELYSKKGKTIWIPRRLLTDNQQSFEVSAYTSSRTTRCRTNTENRESDHKNISFMAKSEETKIIPSQPNSVW